MLEKQIFDSTFVEENLAFTCATHFLKHILTVVAYLQERDLLHLDIKTNNVLISEDKTAVLTDFGFLASQCGALLLYRCPERWMTEQVFTEVNGKKFDMWSVGTLALKYLHK